MDTLTYMNGSLDAGDIPSAAACILADPVSLVLRQRSVERLFRIAFDGAEPTKCDELVISIIADIMAARARQ